MEKELKILGETLKAQQEAINTALELLEVMTEKLNAKDSIPEVEEKETVKKAPKESKKSSKKAESVEAACITEEEEKNVRETLKEFSVSDITDFLMEKEIEYDEGKASGKGNKLYVVRLVVDKLKDGTISLDDLFGEDEEDIEKEEVKEAEDVVEEAEETVEETTEDDEEENEEEEEEVKERTIDDIIEDYELKDMDKDGLKEIADELELKISGFDKKPVSILRKTIAKALLEAENEEEEEDAKKK